MGYSPKHAKPVSLRSAGLKSHHHRPSGAGDTGTGRHRADMETAAYRVPGREAAPAETAGIEAEDRGEDREPLSELIPAQRSPVPGS